MTYASHMTTSSSQMVDMAPLSCRMTPMWYIQCPGIPNWCHMAPRRLPYESSACLRAPSTSHVAPYGSHGEHGSNMAHIWFPRCTFGLHLPSGSHTLPAGSHTVHVAPIRCLRLLQGAQCSHMAHMAPVMCIWLSHGPHLAHRAPI
jgi:hypothetical protein